MRQRSEAYRMPRYAVQSAGQIGCLVYRVVGLWYSLEWYCLDGLCHNGCTEFPVIQYMFLGRIPIRSYSPATMRLYRVTPEVVRTLSHRLNS